MDTAHLSRLVIALEGMAKGVHQPRRAVLQRTLDALGTSTDPRVTQLVDKARMTLPIAKGDTMPPDIAQRCREVLVLADPLVDEALAAIKR